jgi:hypothetical protein
MGQDKLAQGFQGNGRRPVVAWYCDRKLRLLSLVGTVAISTSYLGKIETAVATPSTDWGFDLAQNQQASACKAEKATLTLAQAFPDTLPPPNFPINPGGTVNVPPVNPPAAPTRSVPTLSAPPATLPPPIFPSDGNPAVSVPARQSFPTPTQPVTTSQPLEPESDIESPASSPPVIEFGQPLPKTTSALPLQNVVPFATMEISRLNQLT